MSFRLTDFGTFDEVNDISYFKFSVSKFSKVGQNKISRAFRHSGQIWKLQIRKVDGYLGLFLRWYGTKIGQKTHIKCFCKTGLEFSVINQFDDAKTVMEGDVLEEDIYDRFGSGIGYGEVIQLRYIESIPGYVINDTIIVQIKLKVKATTFVDKIQVSPRPERIFIRGLKFSFHGADWSLILFPKGEYEDADYDNEDEEEAKIKEKELNKATLYLSRDSVANENVQLRHHVRFLLFVEGGPVFPIEQNFHEQQSQVFGTGYLMSAGALQKLGAKGVIRVGVTFLDVKPYFNFAYDFKDESFAGISLKDQRDIPWLLKIVSDDMDKDKSNKVSFSIQIDPESHCKQIKTLETRNKLLKTIWHLRVINFKDADMTVDVWSEQNSTETHNSVYKHAGEIHRMILPICFNEIKQENSPYFDDDGQLCVQISILNSNFISGCEEVAMKMTEIVAIADYHKNKSNEKERDFEIREQIWQMSLSNLEEEKSELLNNSKEALDKQETEIKEKEFMINSLQEKLTAVEGYVHSLESNSMEEIDKFHKTSITKLIEKSKPSAVKIREMDNIFKWIEKQLKKASDDVVSVIPSGAYGEGTLTSTKTDLDVVVFLKGELENSLNNGDLTPCLEFMQRCLEANTFHVSTKRNSKTPGSQQKFEDFIQTPISLKCKCEDTDVVLYPTKNWGLDGYHVIYEASTGLTRDSLKCFITATSGRRSEFVREQSEQCRDLIRILKTWRDNVKWEGPQNRPNSYLLSLLAIHAYGVIQRTGTANTPSFFKEVISEVALLCGDEDIRIEWNDYYDSNKYDIVHTNQPFIRDPALPSHNVAETGIEDWTRLREEMSVWAGSLCP